MGVTSDGKWLSVDPPRARVVKAAQQILASRLADVQDLLPRATRVAADRARSGGGATLVEAKVDRLHAHYLGDREPYRTADQKAALWVNDPLARLVAQLESVGVDIAAIEADVADRVERAVAYMRAQPLIDVATVREGVYAEQVLRSSGPLEPEPRSAGPLGPEPRSAGPLGPGAV